MADDSFEEPFDAVDSGAAAPPHVRKSSTTPNAPPSFAFDHSASLPSIGNPPPSSTSLMGRPKLSPPDGDGNDDELGDIPRPHRHNNTLSTEPSIMSSQLNDRWKQYEVPIETQRIEVSPADARIASDRNSSSSGLSPRQPYQVSTSSSFDTSELIRKYGGMSGVVGGSHISGRTTPRPTQDRSPAGDDVRGQAQRMLSLVDDYTVRRTESGGFRVATSPSSQEPQDAELTPRGKRVPSALAGLGLHKGSGSSWKESGRYTFQDPSFRNDDHISEDEDDLVGGDAPFQDEPVVDVVGMEHRAAGSRPNSDDKFEGDFEGGSKTWSSRYSDNPYITSRHVVMDDWDRELNAETSPRKSARNMFMSTASDIRASANNVFVAAGNQKEKIFGSGGFSFRANHVFGNQRAASEMDDINLRTAWKEVHESTTTPPVHKTWEEVMYNKRKRRRMLGIFVIVLLASIAAVSAVSAIKNVASRRSAAFTGSSVGESVTFYVTSDTPYEKDSEHRLVEDLANIPLDSEFILHLGNIQDADVSLCPRSRYGEIASVLQESPVPLFIVPGAEDWAKCPFPKDRIVHWKEAFAGFDKRFKHSIPVDRDASNNEVYAFVHKGVIFFGLHLVSGPIIVEDEDWTNLQKAMLKFFFGMLNKYDGQFRSIVIAGNARPSAQQKDFFDALFSNLKRHHVPIVYVHANQKGDEVLQYNPFKEHPEVQVIGVQNGAFHPPLKMTVGFGAQPFLVG